MPKITISSSEALNIAQIVKELACGNFQGDMQQGEITLVISPDEKLSGQEAMQSATEKRSLNRTTGKSSPEETLRAKGFKERADASEKHLVEGLRKLDIPVTRKNRKREELPNPQLAADAEVNRLKKQFKVRVDPDLLDDITARARRDGISRQDWVENALKCALEK